MTPIKMGLLVAAITVAVIWGIETIQFRVRSAPMSEPIARSGEWITRFTDNSKVCRLVVDLERGYDFSPEKCSQWTEIAPVLGQHIVGSPAQYWTYCVPDFCWLHFEEGWRPPVSKEPFSPPS
jgi:hypothetical protein